MTGGVYTITSPSGGMYVGSAVNFGRRWSVHLSRMRSHTHHNAKLQAAYDKYGASGLTFAKIIVCAAKDLLAYEQIAMDALQPRYNIALVAGRTSGYRHTDETRALMSAQRTGMKQTPERVAARVAKVSGKTRPKDAVERTAAALRGRIRSAEQRANLSAALLGRTCGPMSEEHKRKIGAANAGRRRSAESIAATVAALTGRRQSQETIAKRAATRIGTHHSEETKARMRATWAAKKNAAV